MGEQWGYKRGREGERVRKRVGKESVGDRVGGERAGEGGKRNRVWGERKRECVCVGIERENGKRERGI